MNKSWLAIVVLTVLSGALLADDQKKRGKDKPQESKPKVDLPKPKVETPKPKAETPKPKVDLPKPKAETPKPKVDLPKPKVDLPKPAQPKTENPSPVKPPVVISEPPQKRGDAKPKVDPPKPKIDFQIPGQSNKNNDRDRDRDRQRDNDKSKLNQLVPVLPGLGINPGSGLVPGQPKRRPNDNDDDNRNRAPRQNFNSNQSNRDHDHDHDHDHNRRDGRVQTDDLIRLFLFSNSGANRPYGYGGYHDGGHYHHGHRDQNNPQFIRVPVQPLQPSVAAPLPPRLVVPTADQFGSLAEPHQRELLLQAINSLDDELTRTATGDQWKRHLQLDGLQASLAEIDGPLDGAAREKFRTHADVFDDIARQPAYRPIADLWGFGTLRVGLREFSLEPIVRIRRAIAMNAEWLSKSLDGVATGNQWKQHLRLSQLTARDNALPTPVEELAAMEPILTKFAKIKADPQFETIAAMPGFLTTLAALNDYVQELQLIAAPPPAESDLPKTLPPPPAPKPDAAATDKPAE